MLKISSAGASSARPRHRPSLHRRGSRAKIQGRGPTIFVYNAITNIIVQKQNLIDHNLFVIAFGTDFGGDVAHSCDVNNQHVKTKSPILCLILYDIIVCDRSIAISGSIELRKKNVKIIHLEEPQAMGPPGSVSAPTITPREYVLNVCVLFYNFHVFGTRRLSFNVKPTTKRKEKNIFFLLRNV